MLILRFLTTDAWWNELATRYWQFDPIEKKFTIPVEQIAEEMDTNSRQVSILLADVCQAYDDKFLCSICGKPAKIFLTRSDFVDFYRAPARRHHLSKAQRVPICDACRRLQEEEERLSTKRQEHVENELKLEILRGFQDKYPQVSLSDLTLEQALFLDAYARAGLTENFTLLLSINTIFGMKRKLAPMGMYSREIVNTLFDADLLEIHPKNPPDVLTDVTSIDNYAVFTESANWLFPISTQNPSSPASLFLEIEQAFKGGAWPELWCKQSLPLWRRVAVWECVEYMDYVMDQHSLPFSPDDTTADILQTLLTHFSTGQMNNFIWRAVQNAAAYYMRSGGSKRQAADTVTRNIRNMAGRAKTEGWEVKTFWRNLHCEQSIISQVLFDVVLKIGEAGFTSVPQ